MDQDSLVENRIEAGKRFLDEFNKEYPLKTAFWLKESDDGAWYLYVASERIDESNRRDAYMGVSRAAKRVQNVYFDRFWVKVVEKDHPLVNAVLEIQERYPNPLGIHYRGFRLGKASIEGAYFYPLPIAAVQAGSA